MNLIIFKTFYPKTKLPSFYYLNVHFDTKPLNRLKNLKSRHFPENYLNFDYCFEKDKDFEKIIGRL